MEVLIESNNIAKLVKNEQFAITYVPTENNVADILLKHSDLNYLNS